MVGIEKGVLWLLLLPHFVCWVRLKLSISIRLGHQEKKLVGWWNLAHYFISRRNDCDAWLEGKRAVSIPSRRLSRLLLLMSLLASFPCPLDLLLTIEFAINLQMSHIHASCCSPVIK